MMSDPDEAANLGLDVMACIASKLNSWTPQHRLHPLSRTQQPATMYCKERHDVAN
jgi:hypothetical protein